jgi:uncharacterized membrane protein YkoI
MNSQSKKLIAAATVVVGLMSGTSLVLAQANQTQQGGQTQANEPVYNSTVKVPNANGETGEAGMLASQAKIDVTQATAAALKQVPGTVLKTALENENGNVVYSVEVNTASNGVVDVKVDAGNGSVLSQDTAANETGQGGNDGETNDGGAENGGESGGEAGGEAQSGN